MGNLSLIRGKRVEDECTEIARELLDRCKSGEIKAFIAVAVDEADNTTLYLGNSSENRKNLLQLLGAVWMLNHFCYEVLDDNSE